MSMVFERTSKGLSGKFQRDFKDASRNFQGCSKKVFRLFQGRLKGVSSSFYVVSRVFKEVKWVFEVSFQGVCFQEV